MRPSPIADEDPAERDQPLAAVIPVGRGGHHLDVAPAAAVPGDIAGRPVRRSGRRHGGLRGGQLLPLRARPMGGPLAGDQRRGCIQLGVRDEPADQRQSAAMPVREPCHLMAAIAAITGQREMAVREPVQEHGHQTAEQLSGGPVPSPMLLIPLPASIQRDRHGEGPGTVGEREADQDCQDDPLVAPAIGGVAVGRADRVAVAPLAVDVGAAMLVDGVIAGQRDGARRDPVARMRSTKPWAKGHNDQRHREKTR